MKKKLLITTGLLSALGCTTGGSHSTVNSSMDKVRVIKCLGVAKAGHNDCGSTDGRHSCSGKATKHLDPTEWVYLPDGPLCEHMGGKKMVKNGKVVKKLKPASKFIGG